MVVAKKTMQLGFCHICKRRICGTPYRFHSKQGGKRAFVRCSRAASLPEQPEQQHYCRPPVHPPPQYLMSSNSPSGGMKLMLLSESNLLSLTHWWKVQSSMAIDCLPLETQDRVKGVQAAAPVPWCTQSLPRQKLLYRACCHRRCPGNGEAGRGLRDSSLLSQTFLVSPPQKSHFRKLVSKNSLLPLPKEERD